MSPKFITFEGGENSGKTTQSKMLYEYLLSKGIKAIHTREPGGTPEGEKIRDIIVNSEIRPLTELLLVTAARYEHLHNVIFPALASNHWVICDRYIDSTTCYQCWDMDIATEEFYKFFSYYFVMPNITFFMDLKPEICFSRAKINNEVNKFDKRDLKFHKNIYAKFKVLSKTIKRIKTIECDNLSKEEIHHQIINNAVLIKAIDNLIGKNNGKFK
jgi:dTMP kinase